MNRRRVRRNGVLEAGAGLVQPPQTVVLLAQQYQESDIFRRQLLGAAEGLLGEREIQIPDRRNAQLTP